MSHREHWIRSGDVFGCFNSGKGVLLAASGCRSGMLLNTLQYSGQPPTKTVSSRESEEPCNQTSVPGPPRSLRRKATDPFHLSCSLFQCRLQLPLRVHCTPSHRGFAGAVTAVWHSPAEAPATLAAFPPRRRSFPCHVLSPLPFLPVACTPLGRLRLI